MDGTNGNTTLQPLNAHFLNSDGSIVNGQISRKAGQKAKTITMEIDIHGGRVQDILALASKSEPPVLTGGIKLRAQLVLPPGKDTVLHKMLLNGNFKLSDTRFSDETMKRVIAELSSRGQGRPTERNIQDVPAEFTGDFRLHDATLSIGKLKFGVPGVTAEMRGSYGIASEQLDFVGDVRLSVPVSQTMTGAKRMVLIPFDPIFMRHGAGTYLPLNIAGTRSQPQIKVNWKKLF